MRYQNWDVLMFPHELCKIPMQEFKTSCQVIQDSEFHASQSTALLLPTVTCFVAGLPAGEPFRISIHSWQNPEASRYTHQISSKHVEHVIFEARVFIDGRLSGTKLFHRTGPWPTVLETSIDIDKEGSYKKLGFPSFHRELLSQSYWNPGDDFGRVKVLISEGFPRDNLSMPFERVKNLVAFSFQHAPLDVLETSSIAWPNPAMWRQVSISAPFYAHSNSPRHDAGDVEAHSHSPRKSGTAGYLNSQANSMPPPPPPAFTKRPEFDPFTTAPTGSTLNQWRRQASCADSSTGDVSAREGTQARSSRNVSDNSTVDIINRQNLSSDGGYDALCEALIPSAPTNTPQNGMEPIIANTIALRHPSIKREVVRSLADRVPTPGPAVDGQEFASLMMDNATDASSDSRRVSSSSSNYIQSRKENDDPSPITKTSGSTGGQTVTMRRSNSHPFASTNITGTKRQRTVTPASSKVIDDEDEPRSSPSLRKVSRQSKNGKEDERRVLSGIENV